MTIDDLDKETECNADHTDLWAMWNGFSDADELKDWGDQAERKRLTEAQETLEDDDQ